MTAIATTTGGQDRSIRLQAAFAVGKVRPLSRAGLPSDTAQLARYLIGKTVVRNVGRSRMSGRIVETEAYTMCLILDIAMPGMTGPDLQRELKVRQITIPIIFMTAGKDDTVRPRLLKNGAVECLFKPFSDSDLLDALNTALQVN